MEENGAGRESKDQVTEQVMYNKFPINLEMDEKQDPPKMDVHIRNPDYDDQGDDDDDEQDDNGDEDVGDDEHDDGNDAVISRFEEMCQIKDCTDCVQLRNLKDINKYFIPFARYDSAMELICKELLKHSRSCDDVGCRIPFCSFLSCFKGRWSDVLPQVRTEYNYAALNNYSKIYFKEGSETIIMDTSIKWPSGLVAESNRRKKIDAIDPEEVSPEAHEIWKKKIGRQVPYTENMESHGDYPPLVDVDGERFAPRPGLDFVPVSEFIEDGNYSCRARSNAVDFPFDVMLKQRPFITRKDFVVKYMNLIERLKDCKNENICSLLWITKDDYNRIIYSSYLICDDRNLEHVCGKLASKSNLCLLMIGMIKGARYLHGKQLYFMNWKASALEYNDRTYSCKLHDFQYIFDFERKEVSGGDDDDLSEDEDLHSIVEMLDHSNIPKELLCPHYRVGEYTEAYGLGCVMFHLIFGRPLLHDVRHQRKSVKIDAIENLSPSESINKETSTNVRQWHLPFIKILENLLGNHQTRWSLKKLEECLVDILRVE